MPPAQILVLVFGVLLVCAQSAHAQGSIAAGPALAPAAPTGPEASLRRTETRELGAAHADAHALQRQFAARGRDVGEASSAADAPRANAVDAAVSTQPHRDGEWEPPAGIPVIAINSIMLPTGKVLMFAYPGRPDAPGSGYDNLARAYVWDPVTRLSRQVDPPLDPATGKPTNIWCGGASLLADGRVLVTGGNVGDPSRDLHGIDTVFTFDPFTETWERHEPMRQGRWYPTQVRMPDGRTAIVGGRTRPGDPDYEDGPSDNVSNRDLELFSPDGTVTLDDLRFTNPGGISAVSPPMYPLYPRLFWMPSGRVMSAGPLRSDTWFLRPGDAGAASTWSQAPDLTREREFGNAVLLSGGRVLTLGGSPADIDPDPAKVNRPATDTAEVFDENTAAQGWTAAPSMATARSHANSVLLPDGMIATIGGGYGDDSSRQYYRWLYSDDQKRVELRDPETGRVSLGAGQAEGRTYHSSALLLPDGRVMSAGDDINGTPTATNTTGAGLGITADTAEIYSPPYLFKRDGSGRLADRPQILALPGAVRPGDRFELAAGCVAPSRAVLVAPGASTHAFDMSQRRIELAAPQAGTDGRIALRMPSDVDVAPPGYYMLFLLSADGVPSIARFVRLDAGALPQPGTPSTSPPPPCPTAEQPQPEPQPQPQPQPEPQPQPQPPRPEVKPKLTVTGRLASLRTIRRTRIFTVVVGVSEPGRVVLSALLDRGKRPGLTVAGRRVTTFRAAGRRRVTFTLTRAGLRRLFALRRGVLRIRAQATFRSGRTLPVSQTRRRLR